MEAEKVRQAFEKLLNDGTWQFDERGLWYEMFAAGVAFAQSAAPYSNECGLIFTDKERAVIAEISTNQELRPATVIKRALATYQLLASGTHELREINPTLKLPSDAFLASLAHCGKNMGNDLLVIPCDLKRGHDGPCERNTWPVNSESAAPQAQLISNCGRFLHPKDAHICPPEQAERPAAPPQTTASSSYLRYKDMRAESEREARPLPALGKSFHDSGTVFQPCERCHAQPCKCGAPPVETLPAVPQPWVSVEDRLPEFAGTYIVAVDGQGEDGERYIGVLPAEWWSNDEHWHDLQGWGHNEVTHWQPLPDVPLAESGSQPAPTTKAESKRKAGDAP